ncbi:hypothetical protein [Undibacterium sp. RuTC16W]|uniref:hypothetical protein n=1 Tax=Undibacterium sp. RuTC16W TaxID=3413048 RepID=UPI003BF0CB81
MENNKQVINVSKHEEQTVPIKLVFIPVVFLTLLHTIFAASAPDFLAKFDAALLPIVGLLKFFALEVTKPCISGTEPDSFYVVQIGINVWGVVIYNLHTLARRFIRNKSFTGGIQPVIDVYVAKNGWSVNRARWAARRSILFLLVPLLIYCSLCTLNGVNGWFVTNVNDLIAAFAFPIMFVLPGTLVSPLVIHTVELVISDAYLS